MTAPTGEGQGTGTPVPGEQVATACPACGNGFRLPAAANGRATLCPFCKKRFLIRPSIGELIGVWGDAIVTLCGACARRVWVGATDHLLDRLCPICHAGRLDPVKDELIQTFDPVAGAVAPATLWDEVPTSFAGVRPADPDAPATLVPAGGRLCGRYVVERLLRVDRVSAHYSARDDAKAGAEVGLQVVFPSLVTSKEALAALVEVCEQLVPLGGQGILRVHSVARDGERGLWVVASEPLRGVPLSAWLKGQALSPKRPEPAVLLRLGRRLTDILARLPQTLSHGFLLPENVLVATEGGQLELSVAGYVNPARLLPQAGAAAAGPLGRFIAPELRQRLGATLPGDIHSAAAVIVELVSGRPSSEVAAAAQLDLGDGIPWDAGAALKRALDNSPLSRPASFFQLSAALAPPLPRATPTPAPSAAVRAVVETETPEARVAVPSHGAHEHGSRERSGAPKVESQERIASAKRAAEERAKTSRTLLLIAVMVLVLLGGLMVWLMRGEPSAQIVELFPEEKAWVRLGQVPIHGQLALPAPAKISVNGKLVPVDPGGRFSSEITTSGISAILDLRTATGDHIVARRMLQVDDGPPKVIIEEPTADVTGAATLRVAVRVEEANLSEVRINGRPATQDGPLWTRVVPLGIEGASPINVFVVDKAGNTGEAHKTIDRDTIPPHIELGGQFPSIVRDEESVRVRLRIDEPHLAKVTTNGERRECQQLPDGSWLLDFEWKISSGLNDLDVRVTDSVGHESTFPMRVRNEGGVDLAAGPRARRPGEPEGIPARDEGSAAATKPHAGGAAASPTGATVAATTVAVDPEEAAYLEVPLTGTFGEEITADGLEEALAYAEKKKIRHVVLTLDSGGGMVAMADEMQRVIDKHDEALDITCLVKRAISASIWVVFASDKVVLLDGATVGGAVVFSRSVKTGSAEVDAKMNSIISADMIARAERKGHPSILVKPMILKAAQVYAWVGDDGTVKTSEEKPKGVTSFIVSDTDETVLTLTARQANAVGLGPMAAGKEASNIPAALGRPNWKSESDFGRAAMERGKKTWAAKKAKAEKVVEKFDDAVRTANRFLDAASDIDPAKYSYVTGTDGKFTPDGAAQWRDRTDTCVNAYKKVLTALDDAEREDKNLQKLGYPSQLNTSGIKDLRERVKMAMKMLAANRDRQTP